MVIIRIIIITIISTIFIRIIIIAIIASPLSSWASLFQQNHCHSYHRVVVIIIITIITIFIEIIVIAIIVSSLSSWSTLFHQNHHHHHRLVLNNQFITFKILSLIFQDLKAQLDDHKPTLNDADELCDWLTDKNKDQPLVAASIKDKFDKVEQPYNDLRAKVLDLEGRLQAAQMRTQEFQVSFDDFKDKLGEMEEQTADLKPVSAVYDTLKDQQESDEVRYIYIYILV